MSKKILVTGANGYIGRHVVRYACKAGYHVIANDLVTDGIDPRVEINNVPIFSQEKDLFRKLGSPDICIHMAWRNGFIHNSPTHMEDLSPNIAFFLKMASAGLTSFSAMGTMHEVGYWEGAINDGTPCNPLSQYGIAKNAMRQSILLFSKDLPCQVKWLRAYYITGDDARGSSIFAKLTKAESDGQKTFPFTSGKNRYDFIDVDDLARLIVLSSVQNKINGIINVCSGKPMTLAERVEQFIRENEYHIRLEYGAFPDRPYDSPGIWGDTEKLDEILKEYNALE
ncbi:MAG: NAD(P)-dependent oxidoreductase [Oscillospiraceae bacterium]|jgi:dTDP-6-deoxy-L-talose 4-dehydrogenase (NAD+)|nr:NAD(P)-dependent oxidoreductase [Oscillospiraceae bacterium]